MAKNNKGYDPNKDYSAAIEAAKASGASQAVINQLQTERQNKINDKYGGVEPNMTGSNKTYSQLSSSNSSADRSQITNSILSTPGGSVHYNGYDANGNPALGTLTNMGQSWQNGIDYAQMAYDAAAETFAKVGYIDPDEINDILMRRQDKIDAQGITGVQSNSDIWRDIMTQYSGYISPAMNSYNGGSTSGGASLGSTSSINKNPGTGSLSSSGGSFDYGVSQPSYNSSYNDRIDSLLNQLLNRGDFGYNAETDPLYQQYAAMYNREGNRAMNDTLAAAAADAGGMNSYAITAAQQANNYYNAQLGDKIPQLYQLAYEMYLQDIDNQVRDLGLLQDMDNTQYNRYRDTMSDWYNDRDFAYGVYRDDVADGQWEQSFDYQKAQDAIDNAFRQNQFDWSVATDKRNYDYTVGQDVLDNEFREDEFEHQVEQDAIANGFIDRELDAQYSGNYGSSGDSGGSSDGSSGGTNKGNTGSTEYAGNEGIDEAIIRKMQAAVGATVDGKWGPDSMSKAGGKNATEAYHAYMDGSLKPASSGGGSKDPYADTRNNTTSTTYQGSNAGVSAKAKQIAAGLDTMRGQIGSKDGIANTLAVEIDMAGDSLSDADARWLFSYFGYDPDEWLE